MKNHIAIYANPIQAGITCASFTQGERHVPALTSDFSLWRMWLLKACIFYMVFTKVYVVVKKQTMNYKQSYCTFKKKKSQKHKTQHPLWVSSDACAFIGRRPMGLYLIAPCSTTTKWCGVVFTPFSNNWVPAFVSVQPTVRLPKKEPSICAGKYPGTHWI